MIHETASISPLAHVDPQAEIGANVEVAPFAFVGPNVIRPFREHHSDQLEITRHDWVETNGNNCLICLPWIAVFLLAVPTQDYLAAACWMTFWTFFLVGIMLTNQFHQWSHMESRPGWVKALQKCWLVLPTDHHQIHHTDPYDRYYCITVGWLNPILDWVGFWPRLYLLLAPWLPQSERESAHARFAFWGAGRRQRRPIPGRKRRNQGAHRHHHQRRDGARLGDLLVVDAVLAVGEAPQRARRVLLCGAALAPQHVDKRLNATTHHKCLLQ